MTAYEDVLQWAESRPWWQQKALARIVAGETIGQHEYEKIAESLLQKSELSPSGGWFAGLGSPKSTKDEPVRIVSVRELTNVNRLAPGQELTFEQDGLTVVFGNNGSGKSGYARVIRSMARTRHCADILPDVFREESVPQSGQLNFKVGDSDRKALLGQRPDPDLSRVAFYDAHCGNSYLTDEAEISYRPSAVQLLEDLVAVCDGVRDVIEDWKQDISLPGPLPEVGPNGRGWNFLRGLSASTTDDDVTAAVACPPDVDDRLNKQETEIARLQALDPTEEKRRQSEIADALKTIADHLEGLDRAVGVQAQNQLSELEAKVVAAKQAANISSRTRFTNEPLSEVGSDAWMVLWRAAERYSTIAYPDHGFPYTADGAVCVLCQQKLDADSAKRLERFQQFVADTTAKEAKTSQNEVANFKARLGKLEIRTSEVLSAIEVVKLREGPSMERVDSTIDALGSRKSALLSGKEPGLVEVTDVVSALRSNAADYRKRTEDEDIEGIQQQLTEAEAEAQRLRDQIAMRDGRDLIEQERARLQKVEVFETKSLETNTRLITKKVKELINTYVTEEASEHFACEVDRLGLERVTFEVTKAKKGAVFHKPGFLNARSGSKLVDVLSEGEQTALGFAAFLTEAYFDTSKSAMVFDDPVSSLDHMKRESVAERIAALAKERQVIVFTHDIAFTMQLRKAAGEAQIRYSTRGVEQRRKMGPGYTTREHPWTAKDAGQRVDGLRQEVATLRRKEVGMSESDYLRETETIAGHMSQTWARIISQVLAEPLVDYKSLEVRVGKLRVVGCVTSEDVKSYDDSYSRISGWASRHDPHPELNYHAPTVAQLKDEIKVIADWLTRVKRYQSS